MNEKHKIKKYTLTFKGTCSKDVSFILSPNDITNKTEESNSNIVYIILNDKAIIYIGEAKTSIKTRLSRGFAIYRSFSKGIKPRNGYKGYKWIELFEKNIKTLDVVVVFFENFSSEYKNKEFRESVEGELCWLVRKDKEWPIYQNEIHFHNDEKAKKIALMIFEEINTLN